MPVELVSDPEGSLEALQARWGSAAPAVEFIAGDEHTPVLAVLSQKDLGCVLLDVRTARVHGWTSHGGHNRLHKQMVVHLTLALTLATPLAVVLGLTLSVIIGSVSNGYCGL